MDEAQTGNYIHPVQSVLSLNTATRQGVGRRSLPSLQEAVLLIGVAAVGDELVCWRCPNAKGFCN